MTALSSGTATLPWSERQHQAIHNPVALKQEKRKKQVSLIVRIGVTLVLFCFLFKSFSWPTLLQAMTHISYGKMLLGVIVGLFGIIISCYQWRSLLRSEQIGYDLAELVDLYFVGIAFSHFLPTGMGGDVVKAIHVGRKANNSAGSASAVLMCRITGFLGMLFIAIPVLLCKYKQFNSSIVLEFSLLSIVVAGMLVGAMAGTVLLPRFLQGGWLEYRFLVPIMKIGNALKETTRRPLALTIAVLYGTVFWGGSCLNYYAYGIALDVHTPFYFYLVAIPFVSLVTFLPVTINGFGLRESAFVYIFSTMHAPAASALLLALLMDAQGLLFGVTGGFIYLRMGAKRSVVKQVRMQNVA